MHVVCLEYLFLHIIHSVVYRFLTDDLHEHLLQCFHKRGYKLSTNLADDEQVRTIFFNKICISFSPQ